MNQANVAALTALLVEVLEPGNLSAEEIGDLAEDLAAHGVLVPSALTSTELSIVWEELEQGAPNADKTRRTLERIAEGEP